MSCWAGQRFLFLDPRNELFSNVGTILRVPSRTHSSTCTTLITTARRRRIFPVQTLLILAMAQTSTAKTAHIPSTRGMMSLLSMFSIIDGVHLQPRRRLRKLCVSGSCRWRRPSSYSRASALPRVPVRKRRAIWRKPGFLFENLFWLAPRVWLSDEGPRVALGGRRDHLSPG